MKYLFLTIYLFSNVCLCQDTIIHTGYESENRQPFYTNHLWGFMDTLGNVVIDAKYKNVSSFSCREATVRLENKDGEFIFNINEKGERISNKDSTDKVTLFSEPKEPDSSISSMLYGLLNEQGKIILPPTYSYIDAFVDGFAIVTDDVKMGVINEEGKLIIPLKYSYYSSIELSEGLLAVYDKSQKFGFIDLNGNTIIPFQYDYVRPFKEGLAVVTIDNSKTGRPKSFFIDKENKKPFKHNYDGLRNFSEGLAAVNKNGKWGFIDKNGKTVIPFQFHNAGSFSDGLAAVNQDGKWGFINQEGKLVIDYKYDIVMSSFSNSRAIVAFGEPMHYLSGLIDISGKELTPFKYRNIRYENSNLYKVIYYEPSQEGFISRQGFIDTNGKEVVPPIYNMVYLINKKQACAEISLDKRIIIDLE